MRLKIFNFVDDVIEKLECMQSDLQRASIELENFFEDFLIGEDRGFMNCVSRVKTSISLREKILRNEYYKKYETPDDVLENLSDLIGIRIECRFIEDEKAIYKYLKKKFKVYDSRGYFYNINNRNIKLQLESIQPEEQKNGFKIYRIDGKYEYKDYTFNFELQIKSIVNMFWGDIEHKIIYKNYNYMLNDDFFKEIMGSIKNSLTMIDNQLLVIDNHVNIQNTSDTNTRREQIESLLAKLLYDIFSNKMKESLGFVVDFRKACYIMIKYIIMKSDDSEESSNEVLLNILSRINEISKEDISFNSEISFGRKPRFKDGFSNIFGSKMLESINSELQWNLFFRILFVVEPRSNEEDFENFVEFIRDMFDRATGFAKLSEEFGEDAKYIKENLMNQIAISFGKIDIIDILYEDNIIRVNESIEEICELIVKNNEDYKSFIKYEDIYYGILEITVLSIFGHPVKSIDAMNFIETVKEKSEKIKVSKEVLKYINTLERLDEINAGEILALFKM